MVIYEYFESINMFSIDAGALVYAFNTFYIDAGALTRRSLA
jgi:hypothetical protein